MILYTANEVLVAHGATRFESEKEAHASVVPDIGTDLSGSHQILERVSEASPSYQALIPQEIRTSERGQGSVQDAKT
ncbi:hypothetical protein LOZ54_001093, partial [Ophidiomyces ophidiicola]